MGIEIICEFSKSGRNIELVTLKINKVVKKIIVIHFQLTSASKEKCFL